MRKFFSVVAIFFLGFGVSQLFVLLNTQPFQSNRNIEIPKEATSISLLGETNQEKTGIVARVIDGDTVELADGKKVRYIGIDTPELVHPDQAVECFAAEAKEENKRLVDGKTVRLEKDISQTDKYGRLLRYVWVGPPGGEAGEVMVNDWLVRQGFAHAATFPPDVKYNQQFLEAEREAREDNRGLWRGCTSESQ
ncbi:thermonuclease family protein [Candidatus Gottesmanbacteria bacterium]|nr:thermonuclease family protein [Candidatus Gottesmanbacteria bacterium]